MDSSPAAERRPHSRTSPRPRTDPFPHTDRLPHADPLPHTDRLAHAVRSPEAGRPPYTEHPSGEPASRPAARPQPSPGRRGLLRALFALGAVAGTGAALTPVLSVRPGAAARPLAARALPETFDELYRGRRIRGGADGATVDGLALHLMRRADGGYLTPVDHYCSHPTARAAVRAAVDELGGARLTPAAGRHGA